MAKPISVSEDKMVEKKITRKKVKNKITTVEDILSLDEINDFLEEVVSKKADIKGCLLVWLDQGDDLHLKVTNMSLLDGAGALVWAQHTMLADSSAEDED